MPRVAVPLKCEPKVMQELERLSRSRTEEARLVERGLGRVTVDRIEIR
jgi:hypothetical protein